MTVQAYVLIQTEVGKAAQVASEVRKIEGVKCADDVTGPYDVIVNAEAESVDELAKRVAPGVREEEVDAGHRLAPAGVEGFHRQPADLGGAVGVEVGRGPQLGRVVEV